MHKNVRDSNVRAKTHLIMSTVSINIRFSSACNLTSTAYRVYSLFIDEYKPY